MDYLSFVGGLFVGLVIGVFVLLRSERLRGRQSGVWLAAEDKLRREREELEFKYLSACADRDDLGKQLDGAEGLAKEEARKRLEQFRQIEGILGERDEWKNMALRNGREHSVAQELLLRECQRLARGSSKKINPALEEVVEAYKQEFSGDDPVAARRIGRGEGSKVGGESVTETPEAVAKPPTDA